MELLYTLVERPTMLSERNMGNGHGFEKINDRKHFKMDETGMRRRLKLRNEYVTGSVEADK